MYDEVEYEDDNGVAIITIDRPDVYNAFTCTTILELNEALRAAIADNDVYALVLTGARDGFCAGADISSMPDWREMGKEKYAGYLWTVQNVVRQLRGTAKPSIAAVGGPAIGAGCDFALACDVRMVGPDAYFREGFVRVGLVPGDGGSWLLPRLIGEARAKKYLLTGEDIPAEVAVNIGLAAALDDDPLSAGKDFANDLLDHPIHAVHRTNALTDSSLSFEDYCERAIEYQWECLQDPEHHEAVAAFNENRDPKYDR
jgi:enoyl-CoA hydratase/carnithine racemase